MSVELKSGKKSEQHSPRYKHGYTLLVTLDIKDADKKMRALECDISKPLNLLVRDDLIEELAGLKAAMAYYNQTHDMKVIRIGLNGTDGNSELKMDYKSSSKAIIDRLHAAALRENTDKGDTNGLPGKTEKEDLQRLFEMAEGGEAACKEYIGLKAFIDAIDEWFMGVSVMRTSALQGAKRD